MTEGYFIIKNIKEIYRYGKERLEVVYARA